MKKSKIGLWLLTLCFFTGSHREFTPAFPRPADASIEIHLRKLGQTTTYIGATEAGVFFIDDLINLGINTYRMWTKMNELEWWDDDDAQNGYLCNRIGIPTIAQIKADQASGFTNTIPWNWWEEQFTGTYYTWSGKSRQQLIEECVINDITPVLVLRTVDDQNQPDFCGGAWAPRPPISDADLNEWWEHSFAIAYWLNVRHNYSIEHFEVQNEPDLTSQGWTGTQSEYLQMVEIAYDAVKFANDIAGIGTYIHAPVVSTYNSSYLPYSLDNADPEISVVDYHNYDTDPSLSISTVQDVISEHNPDGLDEPIWISEWGTYNSSYDDLNRAILTGRQLLIFSNYGVEGITIFGMYDWGPFYGLLSTTRHKSETYYAYRLVNRGLRGAKDRLDFISNGISGDMIATADKEHAYLIFINGNANIVADVSDLRIYNSHVDIYEYSSANKDVIVDSPAMSNGLFSITAPPVGIVLVEIQRPMYYYFPFVDSIK